MWRGLGGLLGAHRFARRVNAPSFVLCWERRVQLRMQDAGSHRLGQSEDQQGIEHASVDTPGI